MIIHQSLILLSVLGFTLPVQANIYKWIDADGKAHFSGSKPANSTALESRNELETKSWQPASTVNNDQTAAPQVELYVTSWCPYCKKAIAFLRKHHIPFNAHDIERDVNAAARKKAIDPGYSGIPLAVINGVTLRGFSEAAYQEALARK